MNKLRLGFQQRANGLVVKTTGCEVLRQWFESSREYYAIRQAFIINYIA